MAMFEQMADLLADYEAEVCRTPVGEVRQTRICKVVKKIPTGDKKLHNTVANSRKPGVVRGRTVLYPEFVDVYVYDSALEPAEAQDNEQEETFPVVPEPVISCLLYTSWQHFWPLILMFCSWGRRAQPVWDSTSDAPGF